MAWGKVPVSPSLAASIREPAISTGLLSGKIRGSASGADPMIPIVELRTVVMGREPSSTVTF